MKALRSIYEFLQNQFPENRIDVQVSYGSFQGLTATVTRYHVWVYRNDNEYGTGCKYSAVSLKTIRDLKKKLRKDFPGGKI